MKDPVLKVCFRIGWLLVLPAGLALLYLLMPLVMGMLALLGIYRPLFLSDTDTLFLTIGAELGLLLMVSGSLGIFLFCYQSIRAYYSGSAYHMISGMAWLNWGWGVLGFLALVTCLFLADVLLP